MTELRCGKCGHVATRLSDLRRHQSRKHQMTVGTFNPLTEEEYTLTRVELLEARASA